MKTGLNRRFRVVLGAASITLAGLAFVAPGAASALPGSLAVTDLGHGTTAAQLAQSLVGNGVVVSNVTYTGTNNAGGAFTGGNGIIGFDTGIVLGTGSVQSTSASATSCSGNTATPGKGVEGPNICSGVTTDNGAAGDSQLTTLAGFPTLDASVLEFDFVPVGTSVQFQYVFSSDEYNEFANTQFNDVFGFFVNGTNCALVPGTTDPVSINTINGGNPIGTNPHNAQLFVDNTDAHLNTEMDGLTTVLTCTAAVTANQTNHMKIAVADTSDPTLDSNVFLEGGSLVSGTQIATSLAGGGQTGGTLTLEAGTPVHDTALLSGVGAGTAGGSVTYTVFSDPTCQTSVASGGTKTVTAGIVPDSDDVTLDAAGTYYWQASYTGDPTHDASKSDCSSEALTLTAPSTSSSTESTTSSTSSTSSSTSSTTESTTSTTESTSSTTSTTMQPTSTTSTTEANCKPGWGFGDKNHCHSGPPGQDKHDGNGPFGNCKHDGDGPPGQIAKQCGKFAMDMIRYTAKNPSRAALFVLALLIGGVALVGRIPERRLRRRVAKNLHG